MLTFSSAATRRLLDHPVIHDLYALAARERVSKREDRWVMTRECRGEQEPVMCLRVRRSWLGLVENAELYVYANPCHRDSQYSLIFCDEHGRLDCLNPLAQDWLIDLVDELDERASRSRLLSARRSFVN